MGIVSALYRNKAPDHAAMFITTLGISVPNFVLGLLMILLFSLTLNWLPVFGWGDSWKQAVMPIITLGTGGMAILARLTRASVLETLGQDYIRTARAKGLRERIVLAKHALPNSLIPVVTVLGPMLAAWLTGTFFVELVFAIPGIGKFFITAVTDRDYSLIMATILIYSSVLVIANLVVDVAYGFLDPRIRYD
jgi:ABC-type dipeptide/oligopeptide/nickel transport system permease component